MQLQKPLIKLLFIATTVTALLLLYFFKDARFYSFYPKCPLYTITGLFCPGCGSQRAISALLNGNVLQAARFNVMLVMCLPLLIYSAAVATANAFVKKPIQQRIFYSPFFAKFLLVAVISFFVLRNIPASPFNWLAPHAIAAHK